MYVLSVSICNKVNPIIIYINTSFIDLLNFINETFETTTSEIFNMNKCDQMDETIESYIKSIEECGDCIYVNTNDNIKKKMNDYYPYNINEFFHEKIQLFIYISDDGNLSGMWNDIYQSSF